jgi:type II secretory pathway pseudopilin PulG
MEMMVVVGVLGVLSSVAIIQVGSSVPSAKGDGAMRLVVSQVTQAREMAIAQRRNVRLTFINTNQVQLQIEQVPGPALTTLSAPVMEGGAIFTLITGVPDSPDAFGRTTALSFGTATEIKFTPQGQLVDQNGASLNGTVFTALPNQPLSARAVSIMGATGRVRSFRWNGRAWEGYRWTGTAWVKV